MTSRWPWTGSSATGFVPSLSPDRPGRPARVVHLDPAEPERTRDPSTGRSDRTLAVRTTPDASRRSHQGVPPMLDYLRILLDARIAKRSNAAPRPWSTACSSPASPPSSSSRSSPSVAVLKNIFRAPVRPSARPPATARAGAADPLARSPTSRGWPRIHGGPRPSSFRRHFGGSSASARGCGQCPCGRAARRSRSARASSGVSRTRTATRRAAWSLSECRASCAASDEGRRVARGLQATSTSARVSISRDEAVVDRARQQRADRDQGQDQRHRGRVAQRSGAPRRTSGRTSASRPIPSVVPSAASNDPVSTSSWRGMAELVGDDGEDLVARQVADHGVVEHDPARAAVARHVGVERRRTT